MLAFEELLEKAKTESIAIHTPTEDQAITLLKMLNKRGFTWCDGDKLTTKTYYGDEKENTCYSFHKLYGKSLDKNIMYSPLDWYQDDGYTIIEFSDIGNTACNLQDTEDTLESIE